MTVVVWLVLNGAKSIRAGELQGDGGARRQGRGCAAAWCRRRCDAAQVLRLRGGDARCLHGQRHGQGLQNAGRLGGAAHDPYWISSARSSLQNTLVLSKHRLREFSVTAPCCVRNSVAPLAMRRTKKGARLPFGRGGLDGRCLALVPLACKERACSCQQHAHQSQCPCAQSRHTLGIADIDRQVVVVDLHAGLAVGPERITGPGQQL